MITISSDGEPLGDVERLRLEPDDILVFKTERRLTAEQVARIGDRLAEAFGRHKVMILDDGAELAVTNGAPEAVTDR